MEKYHDLLKKFLTKERYAHSISTALFMKKNAVFFHIDEQNAYTAGLLHDIAKDMTKKEITGLALKFSERNILTINHLDYKLNHPTLLHGAAACEIMVNDLKILDKNILQAVACHTTGGAGISKLAMYTFMCDYCEPRREYHLSKTVNEMLTVDKNFSKAYYYTYVFLIERLLKKQTTICMESIEGYNHALNMWKSEI